MALVAVRAMRSSAQTTSSGVIRVALRSSLPEPTSALQTMLFQTTMEGGATLLDHTLTLPCPCSSRLPSTVPESSLLPFAGETFTINFCLKSYVHNIFLDIVPTHIRLP